jgi:hypothetical protein
LKGCETVIVTIRTGFIFEYLLFNIIINLKIKDMSSSSTYQAPVTPLTKDEEKIMHDEILKNKEKLDLLL